MKARLELIEMARNCYQRTKITLTKLYDSQMVRQSICFIIYGFTEWRLNSHKKLYNIVFSWRACAPCYRSLILLSPQFIYNQTQSLSFVFFLLQVMKYGFVTFSMQFVRKRCAFPAYNPSTDTNYQGYQLLMTRNNSALKTS